MYKTKQPLKEEVLKIHWMCKDIKERIGTVKLSEITNAINILLVKIDKCTRMVNNTDGHQLVIGDYKEMVKDLNTLQEEVHVLKLQLEQDQSK